MPEQQKKQPPKKRKTRKEKQEQEKYYPSFVPVVTEFFNLELKPLSNKKKNSSRMLDAYIFGLVQYCEKYLTDKCCYFSAATIAEHIHVTRQSVMNSIEKLELNGLIIRTKRQGKSAVLNINTCKDSQQDNSNIMLGFPTGKKKYPVRIPNDTCKDSQQDNALSCKDSLHKQEYIDKEREQEHTPPLDDGEEDDFFFDERLASCVELYEKGTGKPLTPFQSEKLKSMIDDFSCEWVIHAMEYTFERDIATPFPYINRILENWQGSGRKKPWEHDSRPTSQTQQTEQHHETEEERQQRILQEQKELDEIDRLERERYAGKTIS